MDATVGNLLRQLKHDKKPNLDVGQSFEGLLPLPSIASNTGHILAHAVDCFGAILLVQEPCGRRRIRKEEVYEYRPADGQGAKD